MSDAVPAAWADDLALVHAAVGGDADALTEVCLRVQDPVHALALRFTSDPEEAADATQDVLVQVVTSLSTFQGRSTLTTWAWTIAVRHLRRRPPARIESSVGTAEDYAAWLDANLPNPTSPDPGDEAEFAALCGEVRLACTSGMLQTLSREARLSYILGDLFELSAAEAAEALGITPQAHRQRLSRARSTVRPIIAGRCGLAVAHATCSCDQQVGPSLAAGIMEHRRLPLSAAAGVDPGTLDTDLVAVAADELDAAEALAQVFRTDPGFEAPETVLAELRARAPTLLGER